MIINIDDTTNLKRIILEFDENSDSSNNEEINIINSNSTTNKTIKPKSRKTTKQDNTTDTSESVDNTDVPIDFNNYLESTEISQSNSSSQEIIQKPVIPDINRDVKIADNMQNLKI